MMVTSCSHRPVLVPSKLSGFEYQIDPYVGCEHYCYYCYVLGQAETDWSNEIQMYGDICDQLGEELEGLDPQQIYMGYYSDPYQPQEAECLQTRGVLELLMERGFSASILTKSDLVVRDADILGEMEHASVSVSVAFNEEAVREKFEKCTMATARRTEALRELKDARIRTNALLCPVIPFITDVEPLIAALAPVAGTIWIYGLSVLNKSDPSWQNVEEILLTHFPGLSQQIEEVVFSKDHAYWEQLRRKLQRLAEERQLDLSIHV